MQPNPIDYDGDKMSKGKLGEAETYSFLSQMYAKVTDVRDNTMWRSKDVDFLVWRDGRKAFIRVDSKSDVHAGNGNTLFELGRFWRKGKMFREGWSLFSAADFFCVWSPSKQLMYTITANELRAGVLNYVFEKREIAFNNTGTDDIRRTINILVPDSYVPRKVYRKVNDKWEMLQQEAA